MTNQFSEIERKFLLKSFPTDLPLKEEFQVHQAYLSVNPEVRIRRNMIDGQDVAYFLAIKSSGELIRQEVELHITKEQFYALAEMVTQPFITKDFRIYQLPGELELECSLVDKGLDTDDSSYKMKNFWKRTRS